MLEKAGIHQKKEKFSDRLLKHSAFGVQTNNKPAVSSQQQLGSMEAPENKPLTSAPITQNKPITQPLTQKPVQITGANQTHKAYSNPIRSSSPPKPPSPATTTKIPRPFSKIAYKRNTGLADSDGLPYTNTDDVILLNKLGYTIDENSYLFLPRGEEREGLYTYIEKNAGVPKDVSRCIDEGTAFSAEYLKDMDYEVPKGYEIKGDLCCPVEKTAFELNESPEKTAAEHQAEPLIKQLQQLMSKKAEATTPKIVQPNPAPQTAPVINNWNNTGFNINSSKPLALPTLTDGFKHEGEITPRNFLGQVYKNQGAANTEINKATNYALNNKLVPPGRGGAWQPGDGTDNRLDVPVQIYTNPGKGSAMASVKAPPNYATNPDFAGKTLRAFGPDSPHKNMVTVPVVNISDDKALRFGPSAPTGAGNAQKFVADLGQKYTANKNHYLPNVDAKYHNALNNFGDILNNEETAKAIKETGQMPQGFQDSIKQLIPYQNMPGVAPTNNREVLRHEIAHSYNKHQPQHLSPIEGDTGYFKSPQERATGISTIQQDLYNSIGSRAESPEQFKSNISRFLTAPDMERAMDEGGLKDNSKRYLRYLKQSPVQEKVLENDAFIAPAFVQNSTAVPTLKTAEATHELKSSNIKAVGYQLQQIMSKKASTLVVSGIHGDEPAGDVAAEKLKGTTDVISNINPTDKRRFRGKDINRHFDKPAEGSIQQKLLDIIDSKRPSRVVALHEDDEVAKPYAYSSPSLAHEVKEALKDKDTATSAHNDKTDDGVISEGKNPPKGSLEKALDNRGIDHATIETPSKSQNMDERTKTHLDVIKSLLGKEAGEKPGLWANIRAKKARGEKAAKPGSEDYPDKKQWDKLTKAAVAAWQRSEGKNPEGGLNAKGRASYKKETGGTLKAPVTESNPSGERAKRQNSFCSRMCGMKRKNTGSEGQSNPDSRINKSLRKWNCKCGEAHESLFEKVACMLKESKGRCWEGYEPVPGKEAYSEDSCRPKGKKKESELEKEAVDAYELRKLIIDASKGCRDSKQALSIMGSKGKEGKLKSLLEPARKAVGESVQGAFPFDGSHQMEIVKKNIDPSYIVDRSKYLGR